MARDYKHRGQRSSRSKQARKVAWWKWLAAAVLIVLFVVFLISLKESGPKPASVTKKLAPAAAETPKPPKRPKPEVKAKPEEPRFDFYTILPEKEVVVPDYEIKTRVREERVGKAKPAQYILQAGSFRDYKEADSLRAKLALMGIESRVEKAKVGNVIWNRVKMGPYSRLSSVATIKSRLKQNGIDVMVTESGG